MAYKKPSDYDSTPVGGGGFKTLPKGGYICRILKAEEMLSSGGKQMLHIAFDICDGEYSNYFMNMFKDRKLRAEDPGSVKYPFEGQKWILLETNDGKTNRDFKSFCTAVIDSGREVWTANDDLDLTAINGATVGIIFRREEREYNGKTSWRTLPWGFRSVEAIDSGDYYIPEDKEYVPKPDAYADSFSSTNDDLPF